MSAQKASRITLTINGKRLSSMPGPTIDLGGTQRDPMTGDNPDDTGFTEKTMHSEIVVDVMLDANTKLKDIKDAVGITAVAKLDTGQEYLVQDAWVAKTLKVTGGAGKYSLTLNGPPAQEL